MLKNLGPSYLLYAFINLKLWADYMKRIDHGGRFIMVSGLNCSWPRPRIASSINWTYFASSNSTKLLQPTRCVCAFYESELTWSEGWFLAAQSLIPGNWTEVILNQGGWWRVNPKNSLTYYRWTDYSYNRNIKISTHLPNQLGSQVTPLHIINT